MIFLLYVISLANVIVPFCWNICGFTASMFWGHCYRVSCWHNRFITFKMISNKSLRFNNNCVSIVNNNIPFLAGGPQRNCFLLFSFEFSAFRRKEVLACPCSIFSLFSSSPTPLFYSPHQILKPFFIIWSVSIADARWQLASSSVWSVSVAQGVPKVITLLSRPCSLRRISNVCTGCPKSLLALLSRPYTLRKVKTFGTPCIFKKKFK